VFRAGGFVQGSGVKVQGSGFWLRLRGGPYLPFRTKGCHFFVARCENRSASA
jgi:hypothetical protein